VCTVELNSSNPSPTEVAVGGDAGDTTVRNWGAEGELVRPSTERRPRLDLVSVALVLPVVVRNRSRMLT
jgi:hypothetical protein